VGALTATWQYFRRPGPAAITVAGLLIAGVLLVYAQTATFDFLNWDDGGYVSRNPMVAGGVSWAGLRYAFTTFDSGNWHPLTWLSHMVDASLWGSWAGGHHLGSVVLHAANSLLLFFLLRRLTGSHFRSLLVAGLFALHPQHVESVAWISERKDVLCMSFTLLAVHAYVGYVRAPAWRRYGLTTLLFAAALMAKPMAVTFPLLLLLLDVWPLARLPVRPATWSWRLFVSRCVEKWPWFLLAALASIWTMVAQREAGAVVGVETLDLSSRALVAANALAHYLWKSIWPSDLSFYYTVDSALGVGPAVAAFLALVLLLLAGWRFRLEAPWLLVGLLWFVVALLPVLGLVKVGDQAFADRYVYLPHIGFFIAVVWCSAAVCAHQGARAAVPAGALALAAVCLLGLQAYRAASHWRSTESLAREALRLNPDHGMGHYLLAELGVASGRAELAVFHAQRALAASRQSQVRAGALHALGDVAMQRQSPLDAVRYYREALRYRRTAMTHYNLGVGCLSLGDASCAEEQFLLALELNPSFSQAGYNLDFVRRKRQRLMP